MGLHNRVLGLYRRVPPGEMFKSSIIIIPFGSFLFAIRQYFNGEERFYSDYLMPVSRWLTDGEQAHRLSLRAIKWGLVPWRGDNFVEYDSLQTDFLGMNLKNPVGLAAGFDKDGEAIDGLRKLGFGFVEIGSVTPYPQPGNPQPRVFRLEADKAVINRYGFNSIGCGGVLGNLIKTPPNKEVPLGINIGKNKDESNAEHQYTIGMRNFADRCSYIVINVSSPNTPGLRDILRNTTELKQILTGVTAERRRAFSSDDSGVVADYQKSGNEVDKRDSKSSASPPAILLKISPDLTDEQMDAIAKLCLQCKVDEKCRIDGVIVSNTTIARPSSLLSDQELVDQAGGLSGAPLESLSTEAIRKFYAKTHGRVPIIGCGGISTGEQAYRKLRAGASVIQLYTALVYDGFPVIGRVKRELADCLKRDGFSHVTDCIGADVALGDQSKLSDFEKNRRWWWPFW